MFKKLKKIPSKKKVFCKRTFCKVLKILAKYHVKIKQLKDS